MGQDVLMLLDKGRLRLHRTTPLASFLPQALVFETLYFDARDVVLLSRPKA